MKKILLMSLTALGLSVTTVLPVIMKQELPNGGIYYYDGDREISAYQFPSGKYMANYPGVTDLSEKEAMHFFNQLKQRYESQKAVKDKAAEKAQEVAKAWSQKLGEGFSITPKESMPVKQLRPLLLTQHSLNQTDKFNK